MTKENAKDFLPLVQAMAEGKTIQYFEVHQNKWSDKNEPCFTDDIKNYRIKPEEEYVPFDSVEELIEHWNKKRFNGKPPYTELDIPLIWVRGKIGNQRSLITDYDFETNGIELSYVWFVLEELFNNFTFIDGSPIGKIKE